MSQITHGSDHESLARKLLDRFLDDFKPWALLIGGMAVAPIILYVLADVRGIIRLGSILGEMEIPTVLGVGAAAALQISSKWRSK